MFLSSSRVEWVWLHWGEYLKAYEGLWAWLLRVRMALAPELELQLGLQEKLWQLEHHRVLLEDAQHHASHLERLMEEAEGLHVRTEDESVGPEARKDLESAYNKMLQQAKVRVCVNVLCSEKYNKIFYIKVRERERERAAGGPQVHIFVNWAFSFIAF